ncbi:phosphoribosyltransferase-like protein [Dietzia cinnamea]|uniref:phosphoribosyltransferase-like protein n=1 Tax=Dietzia cinnamea TaxID=321318 RepID=UPI00223BBFCA|nr:hypothetical protein [Dietzia cinnamea]MCT2175836.1 hypothetical protein [Dietzia cinnamea]
MSRSNIIADKKFLSAIGHWPKIPSQVNPERWLNDFDDEDALHAESLLESLIFFSQEQTTKLTTSLFHALSGEVTSTQRGYAARRSSWEQFIEKCFITYPTGEVPHPADSGHAFIRLARQQLGFPESRLKFPEHVVEELYRGTRNPIVMVDDFAGSGDQFLKTWHRSYTMDDGQTASFHTVAKDAPVEVFYLPAVATQYAIDRIEDAARGVHVRTAHVLSERYSAVHPDSVVFPEELRANARDFLARASKRAGIDDELGWNNLALVIAFDHSVPNATLPIIWSDTPTWNPLLRRS